MYLFRTIFFCTNGVGLGHMSRCLSYARRLQSKASITFFSLASAIDIIENFGFEADYFVSHYWTCNTSSEWNRELAVRFGVMLERVQPDVVVFDGTWPFQGVMAACNAYGRPAFVWSNRGLHKERSSSVSVDESLFDLVIVPGELGASFSTESLASGRKKIIVPPVTILDDHELMSRCAARDELGLDAGGRYALFSLGAGNINDIGGVGTDLIGRLESEGFSIVWTRAPISMKDVELPPNVKPLSVYPLVRYLRAFDVFIGAAGYNTCCEVVQAGVPSLLIPNASTRLDDQARRASLVAEHAPVVVSDCQTPVQTAVAVKKLLAMMGQNVSHREVILMNGAALAAEQILALANRRGQ